jgi:hypothetical protein
MPPAFLSRDPSAARKGNRTDRLKAVCSYLPVRSALVGRDPASVHLEHLCPLGGSIPGEARVNLSYTVTAR